MNRVYNQKMHLTHEYLFLWGEELMLITMNLFQIFVWEAKASKSKRIWFNGTIFDCIFFSFCEIIILILKVMNYQTLHFLSGFILLPMGHLKSLAKSSLFLRGPLILNSFGEWAPVRTWFLSFSSRYTEHQFYK